jgi:predicted HD phosphohydrolase
LSIPSKISLEFQGGVMNEEEVLLFEKNEFYKEALSLRTWDDLAKDPNLVSPTIESFIEAIESSIK